MIPKLAALLCIFLIIYLFSIDKKRNRGITKALWVPFIWMFLSGSRNVSDWLNLGTPMALSDAYVQGSPIDRNISLLLIIAGVHILKQRKLNWSEIFSQNKTVWMFFVYGALSLSWSDYPFVSFKRLIRGLGTVIMAMVILTEKEPYRAIGVILKRLSFILLPLSVLFIKFYPELGRAYDAGGMPMFTGVGHQKNALGQLCLLSGLYFSWKIFLSPSAELDKQNLEYKVYIIMLPMLIWLLYMANSATSLACIVLATGLFIVARQPAFLHKPRRIIFFGIFCLVAYGILELAFDVKDTIIAMLGRRPDLTNRTDVWKNYLAMVRNPIIGYGYEIFYTSVISRNMIDVFRSTHNGYLEMYLNLGITGLLFVIGWVMTGLIKVWRQIEHNYSAAMLRIACIIVVSLYNWTEATFAGDSNMWMLLFLSVISLPPGCIKKGEI